MCPLFLLLTLHAFHSCPRHSFFAHQHPLVLIRPVPRRPFLAMASTPTPPCGLALIPGLPPVAQAVLHRELLLVHAFLAQIHAILHRPLGLRTTPLMDRVTHPHLRAQLEGLDNTLLLALRVNHTALHYTHELLTALGILHIIHHSPEQLEAELQGRTDFGDRASLSLPGLTTPPTGCLHLLNLRPFASCLGPD